MIKRGQTDRPFAIQSIAWKIDLAEKVYSIHKKAAHKRKIQTNPNNNLFHDLVDYKIYFISYSIL